jgi:peptide deformylase
MIITDISQLRKISRETSIEQCQTISIFDRLQDALKDSEHKGRPGVGLTAIQIDFAIRACVIRLKHENGKELNLNMINPVIEKQETLMTLQNEGCLSLPDILVDTDRYAEIVVKWIDFDEKKEKRAYFSALEALVIQHEIAHMNGLLITDFAHKKQEKVGRNDLCVCGSGKKYKKCCMNRKV